MTTRLTNLATPFTFQFKITASGTPEQLSVKIRVATIAFNGNKAAKTAGNDTITDSNNGFLVAGFQSGDQITVSGSGSNDGTYIIKTVTAGTITLIDSQSLTDEIAGSTIKITAPKAIPDGVSVTIKAKNSNSGLIHVGYSSASALNTAEGGFTLSNNEAVSLQVNSTDNVWLDSSVSGEGVEVIYEKSVQGA